MNLIATAIFPPAEKVDYFQKKHPLDEEGNRLRVKWDAKLITLTV